MEFSVSAIQIPGLDIEERSPGSFRARSRVHPFFALTRTFDNEFSALRWGCQQLERLHTLHKKLSDEACLPNTSLTHLCHMAQQTLCKSITYELSEGVMAQHVRDANRLLRRDCCAVR